MGATCPAVGCGRWLLLAVQVFLQLDLILSWLGTAFLPEVSLSGKTTSPVGVLLVEGAFIRWLSPDFLVLLRLVRAASACRSPDALRCSWIEPSVMNGRGAARTAQG